MLSLRSAPAFSRRHAAVYSLCHRDTLARYGGEEFVIWVHEIQQANLALMAERIRARVESADIKHGREIFHVTVSVGAVLANPSQSEQYDVEGLIRRADEAMYESKSNGRNRVTIRSLLPAEASARI